MIKNVAANVDTSSKAIMPIDEAIKDIKNGVTKRESLQVALRALEGYEMMEIELLQWIKRSEDNRGSKAEQSALNDALDLVTATEKRIEGRN